MFNIALTSDWPSTPNTGILEFMRRRRAHPRIAWMPPCTKTGREIFPAAQARFAAHGFPYLEFCDIDEQPDETQLANLDCYDIIYLTGGDPIAFRQNILHTGCAQLLRQCLDAGRLIVAASGGSMQLTPNISLYRLLTTSLDEVITHRGEFEGPNIVHFELLPHLNRFDPSFLELVRRYSEHVSHEVLVLADGAAVLVSDHHEVACLGQVLHFADGIPTRIGAPATQT